MLGVVDWNAGVQFDKGTEFRALVENYEPVLLEDYLRVLPRNRDVVDPDLALVPSAQTDTLFGNVLDHNQVLLVLPNFLQNQVTTLWPLDTQELVGDLVLDYDFG